MDIGIIGVNYKSADLNFRETLVKNLERMQFQRFLHPFSKVILMTCNRFEVYFHSPSLTETHSHLLHDFTSEYNQSSRYKLYSYFGKDCFEHLVKVTSGLDSAIFAETEIQGQVKQAYQAAQQNGTCSKELHFVFQKSLKISKELRQKIPIQTKNPNFVDTVFKLQNELRMVSAKPKILFVGASKINLQIIGKMNNANYAVSLTNRSEKKALEIAQKLKIGFLPWNKLENWVDYDGVVVATHSYEYLIQNACVSASKPKMIIDLSVPRNVCPSVGKTPNIQLFNIDQISKIAKEACQLHSYNHIEMEKQIGEAVSLQRQIFSNKNKKVEKFLSVI